MTGKSRQPSPEPSGRKGKQAPVTLNKQWKEGGKGCLDYELPLQTMLNTSNKERMEFQCVLVSKNCSLQENTDALCR